MRSVYWQRFWSRRLGRRRVMRTGAFIAAGLTFMTFGCLKREEAVPSSREVGVPPDAPERTTALKQLPKGARWGGQLVYQQEDEPVSLDPHTQEAPAAQAAGKPAYSGLLIPWENQPGVQEVQGDLVARWEQPSPTEYVFILEPNVRYHDTPPVRGRRLTAADVAYNLERMKADNPRIRPATLFEPIDTIETPDETTVRVSLRHPFAPFLSNLSLSWASILALEIVEAGQVGQRPVGTGPFIFERWERGVAIRYRANPAYFIKGQPFVDHLEILFVRDAGARERNWSEGAVDGGTLETVLKSASMVEERKKELASLYPGITFFEAPGFSATLKVYGNLTQPPFTDTRVRQAISHAVPYDQIVRLWAGRATKTGPVASDNRKWALPASALPSFDPAKVRQLLAAAGYPDGFRSEVWVSAQYNGTDLAPLVQQLLRPFGIQLEVRTLDNARAASAIFRRAEPYPLTARADWSFDDPDRTLYDTFHSKGRAEHQGIGEAYMASRQLDQMLERQRQELNEEARQRLVLEIQRKLVEDALQTWLVSPGSVIVVPPWLGNVHIMLGGLATSHRLPATVFVTDGPRSA